MKRGWMFLLVLVAVLGFSGMANATLTTIGTATYGGQDYILIYEADQHLVWLDYTKNPDPTDNWQNMANWVSGLGAEFNCEPQDQTTQRPSTGAIRVAVAGNGGWTVGFWL